MVNTTEDIGIIEVLLQRLNQFRLPRLIQLKEKVDQGETLGTLDVEFLERVLEDGLAARGLFDRHPELQPLVAQITELYHQVTTTALENEKKTHK